MSPVNRSSPPEIMNQSLSSATPSIAPFVRKNAARTALVGLNEPHRALLVECFRQFGIESVVLTTNDGERLKKEKFEACVMGLSTGAESLMEAARSSPSNSRCIIFGIGGNAKDAMRYSKYGINAMFNEPMERSTVLKLIRATRALVVHEHRRYTRVPVVTEVLVVGDGRRAAACSIEISAGGMSIKSAEDFSIGVPVEVSFALMSTARVIVRGNITWRKPKSFGVCFDMKDDRRLAIKRWIDSYLEN
jgi:PilZ domain-containing protein